MIITIDNSLPNISSRVVKGVNYEIFIPSTA